MNDGKKRQSYMMLEGTTKPTLVIENSCPANKTRIYGKVFPLRNSDK